MSRDSPQDLPSELREAIEEETNTDTDEGAPDLERLWSFLETAKPPSSVLPDASNTWTAVHRHIEPTADADRRSSTTRTERPSQSTPRRSRWRWGAVAAALLIGVLAAWFWKQPVAVTTAPGTSVTHSLPDGSTVELNGDTRLTYSRTMSTLSLLEDSHRTVYVRGEAYFEIQPTERPFVVRTSTAQIEVTGTTFAVRTDTGDTETHVALEEGMVQVRGRTASEQAVTLQPGQAVRVGRDGLTAPPADTSIQRVTAWRWGGFAVTAQPLPAIARALERQFGTPVAISSSLPREVTTAPLTLYYSQDITVETILHDIAMARNLSYRHTARDGYVLGPASHTQPPSGSSEQP